jgi:acyl-CoA reductase-like NAD-dependent aldehyde dehydrogenase
LKVGDPCDEATDVGPVIDEDSHDRIGQWIQESGGELLTGGDEEGLIRPTVLANVRDDARISCEEAFGPVVVVNPFETFDEAIERANGTRYGLQAAIFTRSLQTAFAAAERLDFGGVIVNEAPTFRSDQMPYGGVKASGNTREGPAWAIREMTEERLVVIQR